MSFKVLLTAPSPWGFRLQGGSDLDSPISISRVTAGSKAAQAGVSAGDLVVSICGVSAEGLSHAAAQDAVRSCTGNLELSFVRSGTTQSKDMKQKVHAGGGLHDLVSDSGNPRQDLSKKRLMVDTQDWNPRTGTTQSRSFRILAQLTGTESRIVFESQIQGERYARLRDWHHQLSARNLNI
ncbi:PDZ and LIM domain protein 7-like [Lampetra fluviatilis]